MCATIEKLRINWGSKAMDRGPSEWGPTAYPAMDDVAVVAARGVARPGRVRRIVGRGDFARDLGPRTRSRVRATRFPASLIISGWSMCAKRNRATERPGPADIPRLLARALFTREQPVTDPASSEPPTGSMPARRKYRGRVCPEPAASRPGCVGSSHG